MIPNASQKVYQGKREVLPFRKTPGDTGAVSALKY